MDLSKFKNVREIQGTNVTEVFGNVKSLETNSPIVVLHDIGILTFKINSCDMASIIESAKLLMKSKAIMSPSDCALVDCLDDAMSYLEA